jgi:hypothetical protein
MTASVVGSSGGLALGEPRLRIRHDKAVPVGITLFDGNAVNTIARVGVVLDGLPALAFEPDKGVELRLFRYGRGKSRSSQNPTPSRWAALPHVEASVPSHPGSQWLGSLPAALDVNGDRKSRVLLAGLNPGDVIDVLDLARNWLKIVYVEANDSAATSIGNKIVSTTWAVYRGGRSPSWGISRSIKPARFAVGFVGFDPDSGYPTLLSGLRDFMVSNNENPFTWNPAHADSLPPDPAIDFAGRRIWAHNPTFAADIVTARLSRSEWVAGKQ